MVIQIDKNTVVNASVPVSDANTYTVEINLKRFGQGRVPLNRISFQMSTYNVFQETIRNIGDQEYIVERISLKQGANLTHSTKHCKGRNIVSKHMDQWRMSEDKENKTLEPTALRMQKNGRTQFDEKCDASTKDKINKTYASIHLFATQKSLRDFNDNVQEGFHIEDINYETLSAKCKGEKEWFHAVPYELSVLMKSMMHLKTLKQWVEATYETLQACVAKESFVLNNRIYVPK